MRKKIIICVLGILLGISLHNLLAQDEEGSVSPEELWQKSIGELRIGVDTLLQENQQLQLREQSLNSRINELEGLLNKSEEERDSLLAAPSRAKEGLNKATKELDNLRQEKMLLEKQLSDAQQASSQLNKQLKDSVGFSQEVEKLRQDKRSWEKQLTQAQKNPESLNKRIKELESSQAAKEKRNQELEGLLEKTKRENEQKLSLLKQDLSSKNSEISKLEKVIKEDAAEKFQEVTQANRVSQISPEKEMLEKSVENLKAESAQDKNKIRSLEAEFSKLTSQQQISASLSQEQKSGLDKIKGLTKDLNLKQETIDSFKKQEAGWSREKAMLESLLSARPKEGGAVPTPASKTTINHELAGYNLARQGRLKEAIGEYKKAAALNPKSKDLYFNLGYLYSRSNDFERAAQNYKQVLKVDPNDKEALYNLSQIYEHLKNEKESRRYFEAYLKLEKK